jgi:hypothetical protein
MSSARRHNNEHMSEIVIEGIDKFGPVRALCKHPPRVYHSLVFACILFKPKVSCVVMSDTRSIQEYKMVAKPLAHPRGNSSSP